MNTYLASNLCGVAIQDWRVSIGNLCRVVQDDDLGGEVLDSGCWLVLDSEVWGPCQWVWQGNDGVNSLPEGGAIGLAFLALNSPSLVPGHVLAGLRHVVAMPSGDGDSHRVVAGLLDGSERLPSGILKITYYWLESLIRNNKKTGGGHFQ